MTNGIYVVAGCGIQVEEFTTNTAVDFLVTFLVIAQPIVYTTLDVVGAHEHDSGTSFQAVVDAVGVDTDGDGELDSYAYDTDGDGEFDEYESDYDDDYDDIDDDYDDDIF